MKFCMILESFSPNSKNGGNFRCCELSKNLVKLGHDVDIISMKSEDNDAEHEVLNGVHIYRIGPKMKQSENIVKYTVLNYVKSILLWIRKHDYDIIDIQSRSSSIYTTLVSKLSHTPVIGTVYELNNDDTETFNNFVNKVSIKKYDKVLTTNESTKNELVNKYDVNPDKIALMSIGVNLNNIDKIKCKTKNHDRILYVGTLTAHKNIDHLLTIICHLKEVQPRIKLVIIGDGPEKEHLEEIVMTNDIQDHVEFIDNVSQEELIYQMKLANLLVLPSTHEKFGILSTTANACYTPTIAYKSKGIKEVIKDKETGYLVKPENIEELEEKIRYVLENDDVNKTLRKQAREYIENKNNWDDITLSYINIASKLVNCSKL